MKGASDSDVNLWSKILKNKNLGKFATSTKILNKIAIFINVSACL